MSASRPTAPTAAAPEGHQLYRVLGAAGSEKFGRPGRLWHLRAFTHAREREFRVILAIEIECVGSASCVPRT
jgi:hypothetical protein